VVANRIKNYYPDARILVILRNPVERAYSNYRFSVENGVENLSFSDALEAEESRLSDTEFQSSVNPFAYQRRGEYIDYILDYADVFDRSMIDIIIHEEFVSNSNSIKALYRWLGIDDSYLPSDYMRKVNISRSGEPLPQISLAETRRLYERFTPANKRLEEYLGRKIDAWKYE
jgi:hypothetical protein